MPKPRGINRWGDSKQLDNRLAILDHLKDLARQVRLEPQLCGVEEDVENGGREILRRRWPQRYKSMPLRSALAALHRTARVYKDAVTLVDPRTGQEFPTLMPGSS